MISYNKLKTFGENNNKKKNATDLLVEVLTSRTFKISDFGIPTVRYQYGRAHFQHSNARNIFDLLVSLYLILTVGLNSFFSIKLKVISNYWI